MEHTLKTFSLNDTEQERAEKFESEHKHPDVERGAISGGLQYRFTPTGLGSAVVVRCTICNEETNITDFASW